MSLPGLKRAAFHDKCNMINLEHGMDVLAKSDYGKVSGIFIQSRNRLAVVCYRLKGGPEKVYSTD